MVPSGTPRKAYLQADTFVPELPNPKPLLLQVTGEAGEEAKLCRPSGKPGTLRSAGAPASNGSASHPRPCRGLV